MRKWHSSYPVGQSNPILKKFGDNIMTQIISINEVRTYGKQIYVEALIDGARLYRSVSYYEPEERIPAPCCAEYTLDEDEVFPEHEEDQIKFLDDHYIDWEIIQA